MDQQHANAAAGDEQAAIWKSNLCPERSSLHVHRLGVRPLTPPRPYTPGAHCTNATIVAPGDNPRSDQTPEMALTPEPQPASRSMVPGDLHRSVFRDTTQNLVEQLERQVHLVPADVQARGQRDDVLVVAADVEHEAVALAVRPRRSPFSASSTMRSTIAFDGVKLSCGSQISMRSARPKPSTSPIILWRRCSSLQALEQVGALLGHHALVVRLAPSSSWPRARRRCPSDWR